MIRRLGLAAAAALLAACSAPGGPADTAAPSRTPARSSPADVNALLDSLATKGRAPKTGYDRDQFGPAWTDDNNDEYGHNGCDTRNDILRRDLSGIKLDPHTRGCVVLSGRLQDPYTGKTIMFMRGAGTSEAVQIDHVVALSDAWQKGAQQWSADRRRDFANDPLELLAVDGPANEAKGDGDAATWLPPQKSFRCSYVGRQVEIKAPCSGYLYCFANDASWAYWNNQGSLRVEIAESDAKPAGNGTAYVPSGDDLTAPATAPSGSGAGEPS